MHSRAVIVELERDADDIVAFPMQQRRDNGRIHAAGHGDDDSRLGHRLAQPEASGRSRRPGGRIWSESADLRHRSSSAAGRRRPPV
jgi:hypothetical protein